MRRAVVITDDAYRDLAGLYDYIADSDSVARAEQVMERLLKAADTLAENPERGSRPHELLALGLRKYRQIMVIPWRFIYAVESPEVIVYVIADGRRDMRTLLAERLLGV